VLCREILLPAAPYTCYHYVADKLHCLALALALHSSLLPQLGTAESARDGSASVGSAADDTKQSEA